MSARDAILGGIRANRPGTEKILPEIPHFTVGSDQNLLAEFERRLTQMGGKLLQPGPGHDPLSPARAIIAQADQVCSMVAELPSSRIAAGVAPASLHDVDLAIVRARFGIAETGSVALLASDFGVNSLGYLAQRLLILLDPAEVVENLHDAYRRPEFHSGNYLVLQTGPSATADIEGVLIHGAQGVRALSVLLAKAA